MPRDLYELFELTFAYQIRHPERLVIGPQSAAEILLRDEETATLNAIKDSLFLEFPACRRCGRGPIISMDGKRWWHVRHHAPDDPGPDYQIFMSVDRTCRAASFDGSRPLEEDAWDDLPRHWIAAPTKVDVAAVREQLRSRL